jgi:hypothetical protein
MKIFEFEQNLQKEFGDINIIYNSNSNFRITTIIGRHQDNEVVNKKRVTYITLEELKKKSSQFENNKSLKTFLVEMKSTDAKKWIVTEIEKENRGGKRESAGAKPKYNEPTKTMAFRVPISKIDEVKKLVREFLAGYERENNQ